MYRIEVDGTQLYSVNSVGYQSLRNVGDTRSTGVELNADWDLSRAWTLGLAGFVNDATFRRYADASCGGCQGNEVPFAPPHGITARMQGRLPSAIGMLRPQLAVRRVGTQYFDIANQLRQPAYTVVDATIAWRFRPGLEFALYAHDLTDRQYRTYGFPALHWATSPSSPPGGPWA